MTDHEPAGGRPLWHGRFGEGPADELLAFTVSLPFDRRLATDDLTGSRAHVQMLGRVGLLTDDERASVIEALDQVEAELADDTFAFALSDEDIHTAIERRVTEIAGPAGAKLHTGRSRNDQVALDMRLYLRREGRAVALRIHELQRVLLQRAGESTEIALPGYTHLQRAQPVLLSHHLLAHFWALSRDVDRWHDCLARADVSPLGAGALAGSEPAPRSRIRRRARSSSHACSRTRSTPFPIVISSPRPCSSPRSPRCTSPGSARRSCSGRRTSSVSCGSSDAYATGSSMLPQKKNPDIAELARGKAGRLIGDLTGFLATLKSLPLAYNRDLQEDKEPLFDALDTCMLSLSALAGLMATATFVDTAMIAGADSPANAATDIAEHLVRQGTPFREAHAIVGAVVRQSVERGVPLDELISNDPRLGPEYLVFLEPGSAVRRRTTPGGGGPEPVRAQFEKARERMERQQTWLALEH